MSLSGWKISHCATSQGQGPGIGELVTEIVLSKFIQDTWKTTVALSTAKPLWFVCLSACNRLDTDDGQYRAS
jgi:hypothetical protein